MRLSYALYGRDSSSVTKIRHISRSKLTISTISEYQLKICRKFNDFCWNLFLKANKSMFLCIISPQSPPKVDIQISKKFRQENKISDKWSPGGAPPPAPHWLRPCTWHEGQKSLGMRHYLLPHESLKKLINWPQNSNRSEIEGSKKSLFMQHKI